MRAHLFDADGVIFDSERAHAKSYVVYARRSGIDLTEETFLAVHRGNSGKVIMKSLFPEADDEELSKRTDEVNELFRQEFLTHVTLTPGFEPYLATITSAGHDAMIVSNGVRANLNAMMETFGISLASISIEDFHEAKPAPTGYLKGLEMLGAHAHEAVVYEDSEVGVIAAKRAGVRVVGVASFLSPEALRRAGADAVIKDFTELADRWPRICPRDI